MAVLRVGHGDGPPSLVACHRSVRAVRAHAGFTLIELLVTIAIISLLIAVLFPAIRTVREQGRIVVCLANLRNLGVAHYGYFLESDRVPVGVRSGPRSGADTIAPWSFGGKGNREIWPEAHRWGPHQRPMNTYLYPGVSFRPWNYEEIADDDRPHLPVFRCPSDTTSYAFLPWGEPYDVSAYDDIGTSYTQNMIYTSCQCSFAQTGSDLQSSLDVGLSTLAMRYGDRFIYYLEEAANEGISRQKQYMGDHGEMDRYTVLYLAGHAAYIRMDTTEPIGDGWTMLDPELPNPYDDE